MTPDELTVLERIEHSSRTAGTVRFLLSEGGHHVAERAAEILQALAEQGFAAVDKDRRFALTDAGRNALEVDRDWSAAVMDVFQLSGMEPDLHIQVRVKQGVVRARDWFRSSTGQGNVRAVVMMHGREPTPADIQVLQVSSTHSFAIGETLHRHMIEPGS